MMLYLKSYLLYITIIGFSLGISVASAQNSMEIRYAQPSTIPFDWDSLPMSSYTITDSLTGDIIYQAKTLDSIPLFYSKDILTSVCFDNQCRPLNLTVYWNITGRYLGFKLPQDEFLSRYDHEPFSQEDYKQLNVLLTDPYVPFDNISFEALIEQSDEDVDSMDGVSGATSAVISDFVVKGAAYTTFTLWNIVYGPSQSQIRRLTEHELTADLIALILKSPSSEDRIWGLDKIGAFVDLDEQVAEALLENIRSEEYFVAYAAINAITPNHLNSESLQIQLFSMYENANYNLRKPIIEKLCGATSISPIVIEKSLNMLEDLNGEQLGYTLDLYQKHAVDDINAHKAIAKLLNSSNRYISQKAYSYLVNAKVQDNQIIHELKKYEQTKR